MACVHEYKSIFFVARSFFRLVCRLACSVTMNNCDTQQRGSKWQLYVGAKTWKYVTW